MKNVIKQDDILIIESSDSEKIFNDEKWVVFKDEICEFLKSNTNYCYPEIKVYLQDKETERLIGQATIYHIYSLHYNSEESLYYHGENGVSIHLPSIRNIALQEIYFKWCSRKSIKPNRKEGWFKSKKFSAYLDEIGWGGNYAIFITDVIKYDTARKRASFTTGFDNILSKK